MLMQLYLTPAQSGKNANQKIYGHLGHLKSIKRDHPDMKIVLFGCMMQEHHVVEKDPQGL